jgi:hypothetical protein
MAFLRGELMLKFSTFVNTLILFCTIIWRESQTYIGRIMYRWRCSCSLSHQLFPPLFSIPPGISTLDNRCVRLLVKESVSSPGEGLHVYLTLTDFSYPLGLVPGAGVTFRRLERRVSKKGKVYCVYIAVSTLRILQLPSTAREDRHTI